MLLIFKNIRSRLLQCCDVISASFNSMNELILAGDKCKAQYERTVLERSMLDYSRSPCSRLGEVTDSFRALRGCMCCCLRSFIPKCMYVFRND